MCEINRKDKVAWSLKTMIIMICLVLLNLSCISGSSKIQDFNRYKETIAHEFIPDQALAVFKAELTREDGRWLLHGETTSKSAYQEMILFTDGLVGRGNYENQLCLLPARDILPNEYGIVRVSTAQLRTDPGTWAELIDQAIMGQTVRLLKQHEDWFMVQTDYDYIGWMSSYSIFRTDSQGFNRWLKAGKIRVADNYSVMYSKPDSGSVPVTDLTLNSQLEFLEKHDTWTRASTPDGRDGFIENRTVTDVNPPVLNATGQRELIVKTAFSMTGLPYLWGGNSSKANDCSGFVQTVFKAAGIQLPRDSRQQALEGTAVEYSPHYSELMPGDLLFFGQDQKVTHVGISLGGPRFIHQSGYVRVNSLDPHDVDFIPSSIQNLLKVKRIIQGPD